MKHAAQRKNFNKTGEFESGTNLAKTLFCVPGNMLAADLRWWSADGDFGGAPRPSQKSGDGS
jgi:hypothetical protein